RSRSVALPRGAGEARGHLAAEAEGREAGLEGAKVGGGAGEIVIEAGEADAFVDGGIRGVDDGVGDGNGFAIADGFDAAPLDFPDGRGEIPLHEVAGQEQGLDEAAAEVAAGEVVLEIVA